MLPGWCTLIPMALIEVRSSRQGIPSVWVEVSHISDEQCQRVYDVLERLVSSEKQISNAVSKAFQFAVTLCPLANPSDLWHHVIYRRFLAVGYNDQQWKRVSGFALERALLDIYQPRLEPHGVRLRIIRTAEATRLLARLSLSGLVKPAKINLYAEGLADDHWDVFGAVHVKSSIAERIQDDVPASLAFMNRGLISIALTMDAKSFPPPHGDGINHGELGGRSFLKAKSRPKRAYIEDDGQFDALFSFNLRTPPSLTQTQSGKRIYTLSLGNATRCVGKVFVR